ncbi:MAG: elongation factor Ts [Deltaproteobacteria bacterium]|nr:MAG: elongation factor Ts [Deltaproteobacteria bacterium]
MTISARTVKELRDRTGAGMMDCKRALTETGGDIDAAIAYLREKGLAGAAKKAGRVAAEGLVGVFPPTGGTSAVIVELNCETDFVAKTDEFGKVLESIGRTLLEQGPAEGDGDSVAELEVAPGRTVSAALTEAIASIGENIALRRFCRLEADGGRVGGYVHAGGKIGVLVDVRGATEDDDALVRSLAMQVAAATPRYVRREDVPADEVAREREIYRAQAAASGKPEKILDRIADGKLEKYYREICLLEQDYVRDPDITVAELLERSGAEAGRTLEVVRFVRYQLGEGIERKVSNLAEEVAEQIAKGS